MRIVDALAALVLLVLLVGGAAVLRDRREPIFGPVRIVDGDTLAESGRRLRLVGMDAPELAQTCLSADGTSYPCGRVARDALAALIGTGSLACSVSGHDRYGRDLVRCEVGGIDLGREMVLRGLAVSYGAYGAEQRQAEAARRGIWAGSFVEPALWRHEHASPANAGGAAAHMSASDG